MPREVHDWTKDKLLILERYLPGYLQATTKAPDRVYIDAFSGPGKNLVEESGELVDGSPLIALNSVARNGKRFTKFIFIDNKQSNVDELKSTVTGHPLESLCTFICDDVNRALPRAMRTINQRAPTFVFLDTEGIEPRWSTIEAIAPWRVEFLINFPLGMSINRNEASSKVPAYFGTEDCIPLLAQHDSQRTASLLGLYKRRLAELGFLYTTTDDLLVKTLRNQALYYLIFVSKVQPAKTIMSWVFRQPDSRGQKRLDI